MDFTTMPKKRRLKYTIYDILATIVLIKRSLSLTTVVRHNLN